MNETLMSAIKLKSFIICENVAQAKEFFANKKNGMRGFEYYLPEIVEMIDTYQANGHYPYNRDIENLCKEKGGAYAELTEQELSRIVYNSQSYRHSRIDAERVAAYEAQAEAEGYIPITEQMVKGLAEKKRFVMVRALGKEPFKARPLIDAEQRTFWMPPRNTRKGYTGLALVKIKEL